MVSKVDLSIDLSGLKLRNPVILSSGPLSEDGSQMAKAARSGAGAVMTRTTYLQPGEPVQWVSCGPGSLMNTGGYSHLGLKPWIEGEIRIAKKGGVPVIASLVNAKKNPADITKMASAFESAGADLLVMATSAQKEFIISSIRAAKEAVKIPVYAKMGFGDRFGEFAKNIGELGRAAAEAGADGLVAIDTVATVSKIDIKTGRAIPKSLEDGVWRLSGSAVHPFAVFCVAKLARSVKLPIIGVGGVMNGEDALEMMMAGASAVGVCTAAILKGPTILGKIAKEMETLLEKRGTKSVKEIVGLALKNQ